MQVIEIFDSINGEGDRSGQLATFIRLNGCNLRCPYCDTKYSWGQEFTEMSVEDIMARVKEFGWKNVTVTGGEPLIHEYIWDLLDALCREGFVVNVETNGSVSITSRNLVRYNNNLYFTIDYKCPSSGQESYMDLRNFSSAAQMEDTIKFVVGSVEDLWAAKRVTDTYLEHFRGKIYVSPIFEQIEPSQIVDFMKQQKMMRWTFQLQIHKFIWDPEMRGV